MANLIPIQEYKTQARQKENSRRRTRKMIIGCSLGIYLLSLPAPAIYYNDFDGAKTLSGIDCAAMGSTAILGGGLLEWIVWLANPLYFMTLFALYKERKAATTLSITATLIALSFAGWHEILAAENGRMATIDHVGGGYALWVMSMLVLSGGVLGILKKMRGGKPILVKE